MLYFFDCLMLVMHSCESRAFSGSNCIGGAGAEGREAGVTSGGVGGEPGGDVVADIIGDINKCSMEVFW
jgi:hypothetical protein